MALVLDTGVLYAALDEGDADHGRCAELLVDIDEQLIVPEPVCVELDYWIRKNASVDAWLTFCEDVRDGAYTLWGMDRDLLLAAAQLQVRYADQPIGFVDAAVAVTCDRLGETKIATLDHRHFGVLQTSGDEPYRLLPD